MKSKLKAIQAPTVRRRKTPKRSKMLKAAVILLLLAITAAGCRRPQKMANQPHKKPLERSEFFADGMASRSMPPGTVARGQVEDFFLAAGRPEAKLGDAPVKVTQELIERGQERYNVFCSPCHDRVGTGQGMIVRRGFPRAQSFHQRRLREAPAEHFFQVMTFGFGAMPSYGDALTPADRWAVMAYIRALQLSRHALVSELPAEEREKLKDIQ